MRVLLLPLLALATSPVPAWDALPPNPGRLVTLSVEVEGRPLPLYPAPDGSRRWYLEARRDRAFTVRLENRTRSRVGVELRIDGLDVISGEAVPEGERGRLYVLAPGGSTVVRGWRTSLDAVRRFEFVDEQRSYAVRSHAEGARLGWIEARVFLERPQRAELTPAEPVRPEADRSAEGQSSADAARPAPPAGAPRSSHPGTGWGRRLDDRVRVVDFEAAPHPAERLSLRYEYADALRALGVLPTPDAWQRLRERERGASGFARPPHH